MLQPLIGARQRIEYVHVPRLLAEGRIEHLACPAVVAGVSCHDAQIVEHVEIRRIGLERNLAERFGLVVSPHVHERGYGRGAQVDIGAGHFPQPGG